MDRSSPPARRWPSTNAASARCFATGPSPPETGCSSPSDAAGAWRRVTYAEARLAADAIAQALLDRGLGPQRPVAVLSGNSVDHALLMLGCFTAGVPIVPVSAAYSLGSRDFASLGQVLSPARRWCMSPMRPRSRAHWRRSTPARSPTSYINQRAVLDRRDDDVDRLYAPGPGPGVIEILATR